MLRQVIAVAGVAMFAAVVWRSAADIGDRDRPRPGSMRTSAAFAQDYGAWRYFVNVDDFSDERRHVATTRGDEVGVTVFCLSGGRGTRVMISMIGDGIFHSGQIDLRWMGGAKDGEIESYPGGRTFIDMGEYLAVIPEPSEIDSIISSLKSHSELRLRFRRWRDERVTDRVSLNGSTRAIDSLPCVNP